MKYFKSEGDDGVLVTVYENSQGNFEIYQTPNTGIPSNVEITKDDAIGIIKAMNHSIEGNFNLK